MDWLTQYWPYLLAVLLIGLLAVRIVTMLPRFKQPTRHSGERLIRVIGVGGAGGNAINHMIEAKQRGVEYVAVNTDAQVLDDSLATRRVQIGAQLTRGLGAGGDATIGREAAVEDEDELSRMVAGSDLVFIAAGLGGGTGSGAAPVIAAKARQEGALTVGVVTKPFTFEGAGRWKVADQAEAELKANVDTLLLIQNEKVMDMIGEDTSMLEAFRVVNEVLARTVRAIVDVMTVPGLINLDFADVRAVMRDGGTATTGIGWASGPDRAVEAARTAVNNPLLDHDISGAGAILLNVAGASTMSMREVTRAADEIRRVADPEASIIFGTIFDDHLGDELRVTVIATRFSDRTFERPAVAAPAAVPVAAESAAAPEVAPVATPGLEEELPLQAAASIAPVTSSPEPAVEPTSAIEPASAFESATAFEPEPEPEPEPVAFEAAEPSAEPVGFHVAAEETPRATPWYVTSSPDRTETPEPASAAEQPMSSSVATVLAALAEEPESPPYEAGEEPTASYEQQEEPRAYEQPAPAYERPTAAYDQYEAPAAAFEQPDASAAAYEQPEESTAAYEQYEAPAAAFEQPEASAAANEQPEESTAAYEQPETPAFEQPTAAYEQHEAPTAAFEQHEAPAEEPALPQGLAEILRDEPESPATDLSEPAAYEAEAPVASNGNVPTPAPGGQRHEPVRTPTSALVGRFWSRIGKSQR